MRISILLVTALFFPSVVQAQAAGTAPTPQGLGGPLVAGICFLSREAVFANAKVGKAMTERLRVLAQEARAELDAEGKPIETDLRAFQAETPRLSPEQRQTREQALNARLTPFRAKSEQRNREIELTRTKALETISVQLQPIVAQVYRQKGCGLLLDRNLVIGGNYSNDLTEQVVIGLDAKMSTISFNRESVVYPPPVAPAQR